jgi:hypothetical protein
MFFMQLTGKDYVPGWQRGNIDGSGGTTQGCQGSGNS